MKLFWKCPDCEEVVDLTKQLMDLFNENREAVFDPEYVVAIGI